MIGEEVSIAYLVLAVGIAGNQRNVLAAGLGGNYRELHLHEGLAKALFLFCQGTCQRRGCLPAIDNLKVSDLGQTKSVFCFNHSVCGSSRDAVVVCEKHRRFCGDCFSYHLVDPASCTKKGSNVSFK